MRRALLLVLLAVACKKESTPARPERPVTPPKPTLAATPLGLPEMQVPADNPLTAEKAELGKQLFFDKRLSKDGSAACVTCHLPDKGWADGQAFSTKVGGAVNTRHTPTLYNVGYQTFWSWDGSAPTLEKRIESAWKGQMGADPAEVGAALAKVGAYKFQFQKIFGADPTGENITMALASFVRTIRSGDSAWDRYEHGQKSAVSADAIEGYAIFRDKAQCALCHTPPLYSDLGFHNIGVGVDDAGVPSDPGRGKITNDPKDMGAFKTPTLRSVVRSAPYFHDGHAATIADAERFMAGGGKPNPNLDARLKPANLSDAEVQKVMLFVQSLEGAESFTPPTVPE